MIWRPNFLHNLYSTHWGFPLPPRSNWSSFILYSQKKGEIRIYCVEEGWTEKIIQESPGMCESIN